MIEIFMNYTLMRTATFIGLIVSAVIFLIHLSIFWVDKKRDSNDFFTYAFFVLMLAFLVETLNVYHIFYSGCVSKVLFLVFMVSTLIASLKLRNEACINLTNNKN
ncbi:hypothetical protein HON86_00970 [Candidatus Woesearchaeota archaeon]|jgi:hypothetical protein|nr:hypothetical protein [Candidatus Woesearchaeota archaeon]MBT4835175.1 hypothetical protein [Candidatus Woesearchaeota archaeon]MBT6735428.1 hypothetical protein [Candidatus Woesearchaeota archaeon]MBT7169451.1 hypothetical protein [Candidatus Woesearchaeota archaeon]MBT7474764.1 hypothetical protein [Candidatus Woesearchaeota archaeon]